MNVYKTLLLKEWRELLASYKLLIVPAAFLVLMLSYPISMKILPDLLESEMPEGVTIEMADLAAPDILPGINQNFELMGVIVIILVMMGAVSGEREKGIAAMVLVKPVSRTVYFFSKWTVYGFLIIISYLISAGAAALYTNLLFEGVIHWGSIAGGFFLYLPILLLMAAVTLFFSVLLKTPAATGFAAFAAYLAIMNLPQLAGPLAKVSPLELSKHAGTWLTGAGAFPAASLAGTLVLLAVFLVSGPLLLKKQQF